MSTDAERERAEFEAWRETQHWYIVTKPAPDDGYEDGAIHRLCNIAARAGWDAGRAAAAPVAVQAGNCPEFPDSCLDLLREAESLIGSMATWFRAQPLGAPPAGTAQWQAKVRAVLANGVKGGAE